MLEEILAYNKKFVEDKGYEAYITNLSLIHISEPTRH